ncbi:hypothetical protein GOODEAATRI_015171, partial [Goodea atripinnis]
VLSDFQESGQCSQDSMREDSFVSSTGGELFSDNTTFSGSDSEIQGQDMSSLDPAEQLQNSDPEPPPPSVQMPSGDEQPHVKEPHEICNGASSDLWSDAAVLSSVNESVKRVEEEHVTVDTSHTVDGTASVGPQRSPVNRTLAVVSLVPAKGPARWIQKDINVKSACLLRKTFLKAQTTLWDERKIQKCFSPWSCIVSLASFSCWLMSCLRVFRSSFMVLLKLPLRLSNPFRGLLKLGHLERRGAMGLWRDYYCELSPFEFRLYLNAEDRECCDNCSLLRCEDISITSSDCRFELAFPGKRLYLRAANQDEAEDWVDRIVEAVNKCRPAPHDDEHWEVLQPSGENRVDERTVSCPSSAHSSPERHLSSSDSSETAPPLQEFDWTRTADLETDALKEAVLYLSTDSEARMWAPLVFSLSLEALKGFRVQEERKVLWLNHPVAEIRDVVPDVSLGGPAVFKVLTVRDTLRFRAENPEEARSWRALIRGALDSYLESGEDGIAEEPVPVRSIAVNSNLHRLVQHRLKENGPLLGHLYTVPSEKGLDTQGFKCTGCPQQIGPSRGRARLCEFSGQYFCDSCHKGDTTIIPSRMVHNWDLTQRE